MAGRNRNVLPVIMPGAPGAGRLYQTDAENVLVEIDTTGALAGYLVTRTAGGLWAAQAPDTSGSDPGVAAGTPGNAVLHFVVKSDGGTLVLGAHGFASEPLPVGRIRRNLAPGTSLRGQSDVAVAGSGAAYLDLEYSTDDGATWPGRIGLLVPLGVAKHSPGVAVVVPSGAEGDVLLRAVVAGGNSTAVPEIYNFLVEQTSAAPPPAEGEGGPVTPSVPTTNPALLADWNPTEGSGTTVVDKS